MDFADLMTLARVVEDALGRRRLAASICAQIPMFVSFERVVRGMAVPGLLTRLPAIMRKARFASAILCVSSRFLTAEPRLLAASINSPESRPVIVGSLRERAALISSGWRARGTIRPNFDRHLISRATNAARAHFERGADIAQRVVKELQRILLRLRLHRVECAIDDVLRCGLLAGDIKLFMNFASTRSLYWRREQFRGVLLGGGGPWSGSCLSLAQLRSLRPLGAVERTALLTILDALRIEDAAD